MQITLDVIGLVVADMPASLAFYRRLGLAVPAGADQQPHVEHLLPGGIRLCWDTEQVMGSFDPSFASVPAGRASFGLAADPHVSIPPSWTLAGCGTLCVMADQTMATRTFGVEEELLLVDPRDGQPAPAGEQVVRHAVARRSAGDAHASSGPDDMAPVDHEFKAEQAEIGSTPTTSAAELTQDLRRLRRELASVAALAGTQVAAMATSATKVRPTATPDERYDAMVAEFGLLARQQLTCGQHVHVAIESRAEGVAVIDRIAPWLALILAVSANSPFWQGQDSGYASYRTVVWGLWPTAGPTSAFGDENGYDAAIADLLTSGAAMDDGMIYFDARLSAHYPTLEIRVADVCTDVDDAVLVAVLCRALVDTAATAWRAGEPLPQCRSELLRAAAWRASRFGMTGELYDPISRRPVPAFELLESFVRLLEPALAANGDLALVRAGVKRLRGNGTGSQRQRTAYAGGDLHDVVADVVLRTQL